MTVLAAPAPTLASVPGPRTRREAHDTAHAVAALRGWRLLRYHTSVHTRGWVAWYRVPPGGVLRRVHLDEASTWL